MKFNKQLAVILVLLSLLLSAIAISVYFYNQNQKVIKSTNQLVVIYVAKDIIKKNTKITKNHIKKTTIARQFILTKPLMRKEILGKFAKETIYKNEAFLKEKLDIKIQEESDEPKNVNYKYNSYNMSFNLFQNPNYSLKPNDIIKIISVYPKSTEKENDFKVQYVAKNIRVLGFHKDGKETSKSIFKKKIKKLVKKKQIEEIVELKADEIVLDIDEKTLIKLIDNYNKGKQLWMVKSKFEAIEKKEKKKEPKKIVIKKKYKRVYKPKSYPITWYKPNSSVTTKTATISYADNTKIKQTKKATIKKSFSKECSNTNKLLRVVSKQTHVRTNASNRAKKHKKIYKNYILPYINISKINTNWYMICDGSYINKNDVIEISYDEYKKLR